MEISDEYLSYGAVLIELGLPILLIFFYFKYKSTKKIVLPAFVSLTPFLIAYAFTYTAAILYPSRNDSWALTAMWAMSFFPYVVTAIISFIISKTVAQKLKLWVTLSICFLIAPAFLLFISAM